MKENARAGAFQEGIGAHVIALGDVSVTGKEIAVTHTRCLLIQANWHADRVGQSLIGFPKRVPAQPAGVFDRQGRADLRHGAGRPFPAGLNARSL
jgi:hypothetical protein